MIRQWLKKIIIIWQGFLFLVFIGKPKLPISYYQPCKRFYFKNFSKTFSQVVTIYNEIRDRKFVWGKRLCVTLTYFMKKNHYQSLRVSKSKFRLVGTVSVGCGLVCWTKSQSRVSKLIGEPQFWISVSLY